MSTTTTVGSSIVQSMLAAFYQGNIPEVQSYLQPDIEVSQSAGLPYSGTFIGPEGFFTMAQLINEHYEVVNFETRMVDAGAETISYLDLGFTSRATGRQGRTSNIEWYRFVDGKVASIDVYYKDAGAIAALLDA